MCVCVCMCVYVRGCVFYLGSTNVGMLLTPPCIDPPCIDPPILSIMSRWRGNTGMGSAAETSASLLPGHRAIIERYNGCDLDLYAAGVGQFEDQLRVVAAAQGGLGLGHAPER